MKNCSRLYAQWIAWRVLISGSKKAMIQFQIVLGMIPKVEITRHTSELQSEFDNSVLQVAEKKGLQHRCFPIIIAKF